MLFVLSPASGSLQDANQSKLVAEEPRTAETGDRDEYGRAIHSKVRQCGKRQ